MMGPAFGQAPVKKTADELLRDNAPIVREIQSSVQKRQKRGDYAEMGLSLVLTAALLGITIDFEHFLTGNSQTAAENLRKLREQVLEKARQIEERVPGWQKLLGEQARILADESRITGVYKDLKSWMDTGAERNPPASYNQLCEEFGVRQTNRLWPHQYISTSDGSKIHGRPHDWAQPPPDWNRTASLPESPTPMQDTKLYRDFVKSLDDAHREAGARVDVSATVKRLTDSAGEIDKVLDNNGRTITASDTATLNATGKRILGVVRYIGIIGVTLGTSMAFFNAYSEREKLRGGLAMLSEIEFSQATSVQVASVLREFVAKGTEDDAKEILDTIRFSLQHGDS